MKRHCFSGMLLGLVLLAFLSGCRRGKAEQTPFAETSPFRLISLSRHQPLSQREGDTLSPACDVRINLYVCERDDSAAQAINRAIVKAAFRYDSLSPRAAVDTFVQQYVRNYLTELRPFYKADEEDGRTLRSWYCYEFFLDSEVRQGKGDTLNYILRTYSYAGGAHGYENCTFLNFTSADGRFLTADDLFRSGSEERLGSLLLKELMRQKGASNLGELQRKSYLLSSRMYPSANFLIEADSIAFLYNPYEIAPYSEGTVTLRLSYEALSNILKP